MKTLLANEVNTVNYKFYCNDKFTEPVFVFFPFKYFCDYETDNNEKGWTMELTELRNVDGSSSYRIIFGGYDECSMYSSDYVTLENAKRNYFEIVKSIPHFTSPTSLINALCQEYDFVFCN